MSYLSLQYFVGWQPDDVADLSGLQIVVKFRLGEGGIRSEQQPHHCFQIALYDRLDEFLLTCSAVDVAGS